MAKVPIPYMPRLIWHRLFMRGAASHWQAQRGKPRRLRSRHAGRPSRRAGPVAGRIGRGFALAGGRGQVGIVAAALSSGAREGAYRAGYGPG